MQIRLYPTVIFGRASQFLAATSMANTSSSGSGSNATGGAATGLHTAEAENRKKAAEIVQDILDHFELPRVPVPDFPPAADPQPPAHTGANVTAPQLPVAKGSNSSIGSGGSSTTHDANPLAISSGAQARADARDMAAATLQTFDEMVETDGALAQQREAFLAFWSLAAAAHPVPACRAGAAALLSSLPEWWPKGAGEGWRPPAALQAHAICGQEIAREHGAEQRYYSCQGSRDDTRGYTCGMWMLLHAMSVGYALMMPKRLTLGRLDAALCTTCIQMLCVLQPSAALISPKSCLPLRRVAVHAHPQVP